MANVCAFCLLYSLLKSAILTIVNESEVVEMTRRDKLILVENICMYASGLFLVWFAASFVDVLAHNMSDYNYAWWNFFQLWF